MSTAMKLTLDAFALKPFTKALTCLSKYGDELSIYATPDCLFLSATNSSKSAYCRFKYDKIFFSTYSVGAPRLSGGASGGDLEEEEANVTGQLMTKSVLSVLRHRAVEKTVDRCEVSIVEGHEATGDLDEPSEDVRDDLETRLVMRFYCKHGVIKTHRLILLTPTALMAPDIPDALNESNLTIGPKALRDMIEHFPLSRGSKSDPQLIWSFGETYVELKSLESSIDTKGKAQLATELNISAEEFDVYDIYSPTTTIAFHLREFNATIAYADAMSMSIDLHFTDPAAPLFIDVEGDNFETLFVISTSQVHGAIKGSTHQRRLAPESKKREREEAAPPEVRYKKPMKAAQLVDPRMSTVPRSQGTVTRGSSHAVAGSSQGARNELPSLSSFIQPPQALSQTAVQEPLFLPSSQLSAKDEAMLRETGLGIENMGVNELADMWEGEAEEVAFNQAFEKPSNYNVQELEDSQNDEVDQNLEDLQMDEDSAELAPTQNVLDDKEFQALFED